MIASSFCPERVGGVQRPVQVSCRSVTHYRTPFLSQTARIGSRKYNGSLGDAISGPSVVSGRRSINVRVRGYNNGSPGVPDRVVGALPYLLPLFDGLRYGKFLFVQFPVLASVIAPLNPLIQLYFSVPFASLAVFFSGTSPLLLVLLYLFFSSLT